MKITLYKSSNPVGRAIISDPSKAHLLGFFIVILKSLF
ncbi:peptidylprolyl isomerase [Vibrio cholerae]|nr:peptidylprolyl isomerase [Vibrio cholerae]EGR4191012.1 peptidylprolyl isomerase [Vibrio cholerae]EGR4314077.1 peptidylprolyl isomerase [Vibrio cholerae]KAA1201599.1 peptidylprolyl isomerase [Vibrio cholerae]TYW37400.1 peptidylprolyl isomerase [Vibrio cholerae]